MLLKSQSLTIERPARATGTLIGFGASAAALALAVALFIKAVDWPVSFPQFLAFFGVGVLLLLALAFAFWAYGCLSLRYTMDGSGLTVGWGLMRHFISIETIEKMIPGRGEHRPRVQGLGWWGYHVGRGQVQGLGSVLFFSTHRAPEELVYVQTADAIYALSPLNPERFIASAQRLQKGALPVRPSGVERDIVSRHPIWVDRKAQALAMAALLVNLALWGFLFAAYPHLNSEITIEFPPVGDITTLHDRVDILRIPATATAFLAVNLLAALSFQWRERAAAYLLLSGSVFFQALFLAAGAIAVINA
ncbi:MAG: hypothetical protein E6J42_01985 [Chloroflexi bacterium]|nr:MAG: hypothetical protein E6J42_01985 [Chloroflexota bacterium]